MTLLKLKQEIARLSQKNRRELNAYMIRLRHERPDWQAMASKRMQAMDAGAKVSLEDLSKRVDEPR
jgi:hypothetical protein